MRVAYIRTYVADKVQKKHVIIIYDMDVSHNGTWQRKLSILRAYEFRCILVLWPQLRFEWEKPRFHPPLPPSSLKVCLSKCPGNLSSFYVFTTTAYCPTIILGIPYSKAYALLPSLTQYKYQHLINAYRGKSVKGHPQNQIYTPFD